MGIIEKGTLPNVEEVLAQYPVTAQHTIAEHRAAISNILQGRDNRLILITGPCSAYPSNTVREFSEKLKPISEEVQDKVLIILRTYIQKPRTTVGWPGPLNHPNPLQDSPDLAKGIVECRKMMVDVARMHPIADEMLFTHNENYFTDILSYMALGARSAEDMEHRYIASGLDMPVGIKNPTSGDIKIGINGVEAVQYAHEAYAYRGRIVGSTGNPDAHLILRGGTHDSNYGPRSISEANKHFTDAGIQNPAIIIDASHENSQNGSGKDPNLQAMVIETVLAGKRRNIDGYQTVKGFMVESFLEGGKQKISPTMNPRVSITDACIDFEANRRIIHEMADSIN